MKTRDAERELRIGALESRIGALLKNWPEPKKVKVEEGEYANYEVVVTPAAKGDGFSFIPID